MTSSLRTSSLCLSTTRPSRICSFKASRSLLAVAMTGRSVVLSRRLASWKPMPRDAGETKSHGFDMAVGGAISRMWYVSRKAGEINSNSEAGADAEWCHAGPWSAIPSALLTDVLMLNGENGSARMGLLGINRSIVKLKFTFKLKVNLKC